jgi:hypothetical protein
MVDELTNEEFEKEHELFLPPRGDRKWILQRLAELVKARGYEHLVLAPLVEPSEDYFPDAWKGGVQSLRRLARRCLVYADLDDIDIEVKVYKDDDVGGPVAPAGIGAPVWFQRRQSDKLFLAARASALNNPMLIVPATARAVTEGWRAHHGLMKNDQVAEQREVDLTAIYLGFGRLTLDAAIRHGAERQGGFRLQRTKTRLGVLPPQGIAFALAVQLQARGASRQEIKGIKKSLQANQAGFLTASIEALRRREANLADDLGLPPRDQWDDPPDLEDLTAPLRTGSHTGVYREADDNPPEEEDLGEDRGVLGKNEGKPVFRVERSMAMRLAKMLALPVVLLGILAGRMQMGIEIAMWKVGLTALVLGGLGLAVGRMLPDARCSEPTCGTPLPKDATICPRCKGTIMGVIHHPRERLAAEEALKRDQPADDGDTP